MRAYLRIVRWRDFQHYTDRSPPWVKLHRDLLTSETWVGGTDADRTLAVACMLLAAATDNRIPADPTYLRRVAYLNADPDWSRLLAVQFLEIVSEDGTPLAAASELLANGTQCSSEEIGERQRREDAEALARPIVGKSPRKARPKKPERPPFDPSTVSGLNLAAWQKWVAWRAEAGGKIPPIAPASMEEAARELARFGDTQAAVVAKSIASGWQGLFPLKHPPLGAPKRERDPTPAEIAATRQQAARDNAAQAARLGLPNLRAPK